MTDKTIFTPDQGTVTPNQEIPSAEQGAPVTPTQPIVPLELAELVGEGKKYKSVEEAQKAIPHAQQHISTLEADNARMKEELIKRATAEELLKDIRNNEQQSVSTNQGVEVNKDVVSEIVKQQLSATRIKEVQDANTASVVDAFRNTYAEKAEENYNKLAQDNGMTIADINELAGKSPKALLKLAGLSETKQTQQTNFSSDVNTQAHLNSGGQAPVNARVVNYGKNSDVADGMKRAKEIVNARLLNS